MVLIADDPDEDIQALFISSEREKLELFIYDISRTMVVLREFSLSQGNSTACVRACVHTQSHLRCIYIETTAHKQTHSTAFPRHSVFTVWQTTELQVWNDLGDNSFFIL